MGAEETSSTAEPPHQQQRAAASSPSTHRRLALVPISLDVRVDAKTGLTVPPILLPSVDNGEGGGEVRLSKADVARTFVAQDGDKLGFVSREHVLIRVEPAAGNEVRPKVIVRSLATNQVSIRRGAHAEAHGVAPYSLTLLNKGSEEELFVGDHLQLLNPPFDRLGCHSLTLQLTVLPTAANYPSEEAQYEQGASAPTQQPQQHSDAAAKTVRRGSGLDARPPVPLSSSLFSPPLRDAEEDKREEEEEEDNEGGEEPALSERGLAAVFASPPLAGMAGAMRPVSQSAAPGGRGKGAGIQPTPALPPLPPPAHATLSKERGPGTESEGEEADEEEKESAASAGGERKRPRPAEAEEEGDQEGAAVAGVQSKKRRRSLGDALGGWISSLFASASKSGHGCSE